MLKFGLCLLTINFWVFAGPGGEPLQVAQKSMSALEQAIKNKNFALAKSVFSDDFTYKNLGGGGCSQSQKLAMAFIESYPHSLARIAVEKVDQAGPDLKVLVRFHYKNGESAPQKMLMTANGLFLELAFPNVDPQAAAASCDSKKQSCAATSACDTTQTPGAQKTACCSKLKADASAKADQE